LVKEKKSLFPKPNHQLDETINTSNISLLDRPGVKVILEKASTPKNYHL